ncbi:hypothetical protein [Tsuneonella aeria]|uniref:hypothetical protein n=1 Tax=Tsuneonella aeria TaxID=1837929 RepID=UPI001F44D0DC|nr:hypothetical protein [Tsuneonella aeria]
MSSAREPIDGTFFGLEFSIPHFAGIACVALCGVYAFWVFYRAMKTGIHDFRHRTVRSEEPHMFAFQVGLTAFLGAVAVAGAIVWALDLGMKP